MGKKKTHEEFINECYSMYGDKFKYLSKYNGTEKKIIIECPVHGVYTQIAKVHLRGNGCPRCVGNVKRTTEEFISSAKKIHGDEYDYSLTQYISNGKIIKVICGIHGMFETYPKTHLEGAKCMKCTRRSKPSTDEFIIKCKLLHGERYDYTKVLYGRNNKEHVTIICREHGEYLIRPNDHLMGKGCKICADKSNVSKAVREIETILQEHQIKFEREYIFHDCKNINHLRYDFYLPDYNLVIEYDGAQHYIAFDHWGGEEKLSKTQHNDGIKDRYCAINGIDILRIKYTENHIETVKRKLKL